MIAAIRNSRAHARNVDAACRTTTAPPQRRGHACRKKRRSAQSTLVSQGTLGPGDPGGWLPAVG